MTAKQHVSSADPERFATALTPPPIAPSTFRASAELVWTISSPVPYLPAHGAPLVVARHRWTCEVKAWLNGHELPRPLGPDVEAMGRALSNRGGPDDSFPTQG